MKRGRSFKPYSDYWHYDSIWNRCSKRRGICGMAEWTSGAYMLSPSGLVLRPWYGFIGITTAHCMMLKDGKPIKEAKIPARLFYLLQLWGWRLINPKADDAEKNYEITRWHDGTHYYAKAFGRDVQIGNKVKWSTYGDAVKACGEFLERLGRSD